MKQGFYEKYRPVGIDVELNKRKKSSTIILSEFYDNIRPVTIKDFFNKEIIDFTKENVYNNKNNRIILITGESGNGKTTLARVINNDMHIKLVDINERTASILEGVKELFKNAINSKEKTLFVFDDFNLITNQAQIAISELFKDLPEHVTVILISSDKKWLERSVYDKCNLIISIPNPTRQEIENTIKPIINSKSLQIGDKAFSLLLDKLEGKNLRECINSVILFITLNKHTITANDIIEYIG